ncbi:hypothetical protein MAE02_56590 [Microvirga aerophila]|uniref:Uncharacterized protein n=1 Tax=Microvirga aerophila TaxID=670291 RepID=A0A512C187_9HYPH|nr:hypothetical protein MAE02_56590 [Microvirga aerophila]
MPQPSSIYRQGGFACRNIGGRDPDLGGGLFSLGLTGDGSCEQLLSSLELSLRSRQNGSIASQGCHSAGDLRLKLAIIEVKQKISGFNLCTVMDMPLNNGAVDTGPHSYARGWFDPADAGPGDWHCLCVDRSGDHSDWGRALLRE